MPRFLNNLKKEDILIFIVIIGTLVIFYRNTLDNYLIIKFVFASIVLIVNSIILFTQRKKWNNKQGFPILFGILIFYLLFSGLTLIFTTNLTDGVFSFFKVFLFVGFIFTNFFLYTNYTEFIKSLVKSITIACSIIIVISIFQIISISQTIGINHHNLYNVYATIGHKNLLSEILFLCFPFSIYASFYLNRYFRILGILTSSLSAVLITVLMSRSVWVAIIAGIIFTFIFNLTTKNKLFHYTRNFFCYSIVLLILISSSVLIYSKIDKSNAFQKQVQKITNLKYDTVKDRIILWKNSYALFKEKPLLGNGLGSWKINILKYGNQNLRSEDNLTFYQRPHNDYLWILCEGGILTLCCFLLIFIFCFISAYKLALTQLSENEKVFILLFLFTIAGYLTFSFFSFPIERIEHLIIISFLISSILLMQKDKLPKIQTITLKYKKITITTLMVISAISFIWGIYRLKSEVHLKKAFEYRNQSKWNLLIQEIDKSNTFLYKIDPFSTPLTWYRGVANYSLGNYLEAENDFENAYKINPYHIHVLNNLGTCKGINKHEKEAIKLYKRAIEIAPNFNEVYYNLSTLYYQSQELDSAIICLSKIDNTIDQDKYLKYVTVIVGTKIHNLISYSDDKNYVNYINNKIVKEEWIINVFTQYLQTKKNIEYIVISEYNTNFK